MQRGDFATKICEIATKFLYLIANATGFFVNFEPCNIIIITITIIIIIIIIIIIMSKM